MTKRILDEKGASLLIVMLVIAMFSVIIVQVLGYTRNADKNRRTAAKTTEIDNVMAEIQSVLDNKLNCAATVFGASGSSTTMLSGLKELDTNGMVKGHPTLKISTPTAPVYVARGVIINGMFLKWLSNTPSTANYELYITFIKNVKAVTNPGAIATNSTYGPNYTTRKITMQLDNCQRLVAFGNTMPDAVAQCTNGGGIPSSEVVPLYYDVGITLNRQGVLNTQYAMACRFCGTRTVVQGCI